MYSCITGQQVTMSTFRPFSAIINADVQQHSVAVTHFTNDGAVFTSNVQKPGSPDSGHFSGENRRYCINTVIANDEKFTQDLPSYYYSSTSEENRSDDLLTVEIDFDVILEEFETKFGFALNAYRNPEDKNRVIVRPRIESILEASPADRAGLWENDEIIEINGFPVKDAMYENVVNYIHECIKAKHIRLKVKRKLKTDAEEYSPTNGILSSSPAKRRNGRILELNLENLPQIHKNMQQISRDPVHKKTNSNEKLIMGTKNLKKRSAPQPPKVESIEMSENSVNGKVNHEQNYESCYSSIDVEDMRKKQPQFSRSLDNVSNDVPTMDGSLYASIDKSKLKKYQDEMKKKKETEMKHAAEAAFLRSSLRGSKKLQALEKTESGRSSLCHNNEAFHDGEEIPPNDKCTAELNQILISIQHLTQQASSSASDDSGIQRFDGNLENIVNYVVSTRNELIPNIIPGSTRTLEEVLFELSHHQPQSLQVNELLRILEQPLLASLFPAHDETAQILCNPEASTSQVNVHNEPNDHIPDYYPDQDFDSSFYGLKETCFDSKHETCDLRIVRIFRDGDLPLGATVRNEGDSILIGRIVKGGVAEKSGLLKEGDELLEVNGVELRGKTVHEVCDILAKLSGELTFILAPAPPETFIDSVPHHVIKHVRALFNYEPEDDPYVPCRELGLHFAKGDILHVISMLDPHWWQALRDGEENVQQLAGLIPSAGLQIQKEQYNRELGLVDGYDDDYQGPFLICTRGLRVRTLNRKKKLLQNDDRNPNGIDDIPTYEEVALYLSPTGRRRPLILVGPQNVGCLELRQRLIEREKEIFSGVVPHTTRPKRLDEQDGVHYHFLNKAEFQDAVANLKFVEWGEYQKHYYGTSFDAIKRVMQRGKMCILTLKVQNIKNLRNSEFMPFVVFISPPSFERLKLNRRKMGEKDVKEDDLKAIIYEAKETEDKYGHLFDKVIVNYDLDRAYQELRTVIHRLETEPQWVPCHWLKDPNASLTRY